MKVTSDLFPKRRPLYQTPERDKFLRENKDVDLYVLADTLKLRPRTVLTYLQRLGLRPFSDPHSYRKTD